MTKPNTDDSIGPTSYLMERRNGLLQTIMEVVLVERLDFEDLDTTESEDSGSEDWYSSFSALSENVTRLSSFLFAAVGVDSWLFEWIKWKI